MDVAYAITYIFEDRKWVGKITILALVMCLSVIPIFGLLATAVGLGFLVQVADNVRNGLPRPLPEWDDYSAKFALGGQVLGAMITYNLPLILLTMCMAWSLNGLGNAAAAVALCCFAPIMLVYTALAWSLLAIGVAEFIETGETSALYRVAHLFDVLRNNANLTLGWALLATLVNVGIVALSVVICAGWVAIAAFALPVHGHLLGQYAQKLGVTNKPRPRPPSPAPRRT